jgi:hypothetical protein
MEASPTFTAGEAEKLTGVSTAVQRDWRRHGHIPKESEGWTNYDLLGLSRLLLLNLFSRYSTPAKSVEAVNYVAPAVAAHVKRIIAGEDRQAGRARTAIIWATGEICTYPTPQDGFDAGTEQQQAGPCVVVDAETIGTLFGIKVRDYLRERARK